MFWVVCYDIPDDKRRRAVVKIMEGTGRRVQFSVFECELDLARLDRLVTRVKAAIHAEEDDVRLYPLNEGDLRKIVTLGRAEITRNMSNYIV